MSENTEFMGLGYDQVLLVPGASNVLPYSVTLRTKLSKEFTLNIPLVSESFSPETDKRVIPTALNGGLGVIAEQEDLIKQVASFKKVKEAAVDTEKYPNALIDSQNRLCAAAEVWLVDGAQERVSKLVTAGADAIFFYLHESLTKEARDIVKATRQAYPDLLIAVGVVESQSIAAALYEAGADTILAGRSVESSLPNDVTYPFLTVTMNIADVAAAYENKSVIAVGGIHYSGDVVKAIAAGADATMVSDLLNGSVLQSDGSFKEGNMSIDDAIFQTDGGLRAGMGYTGSETIEKLKLNAKIVQITDNGLRESHPHDVEITKQAPNYAKG
ncbi:guanosine monophosphate reductase [Leuconostoc litchii]|uniref:IMP dehydrogenase n=1 Tax=Leuconostoc litchii TaxID=1981069 RepID=A0A6P2CMN4_9LACO|nr:IMP dehydrogenase [Leuconostoc litchii]TYC47288.1 IMP dehydrogenase [Leuconostoc litchii]GMA69279.1 guanosine monophosphate reductase [Leuconostoc litchii]